MMNLLQAATAAVRPRGVPALVVGGLLAASTACNDDGPMGRDEDVASVQFSSQSETIELGSTSQLSFEIRDQDGNLVNPDDVTIDFSTSAASVATVSASGLVTSVGTGTAVITIQVGSVMDTITITVTPEISSIEFDLPDLQLVTGEMVTLGVTVLDMAGAPVTDPGLVFTSSNEAVATVDDDGVVTAVAEGGGPATITAAGGGESATIEIEVFPAGSGGITLSGNSFTVLLGDAITIDGLVEVRDASGVIIPDAELQFDTTDDAVATVDAMGLLSALALGDALITVTSPDALLGIATFRLNVVDGDGIDSIALDPDMATVAIGATLVLTAEAMTTAGDPIDDILVVYSSSDETVATVHPVTGEVTGVAAGTATITATSGALTAESTITVE